MPKKSRNKGFSHIGSLPSIKIDCVDEIPLRSIKEENLRDLTATTGPNVRGLQRNSGSGRWSPISISSDEEDYESEMRDFVADDLQGNLNLF